MEIIPTNEVCLLKSIPFCINYQDIILFDNIQAQQNYFNSQPKINIENVTYVRNNGSIKVPYNREAILDYNYMSFKNSNYGDKIFYAFITDVQYINPNTSMIFFSIDEWQTWCFDLTFKPCFIERKHCKRWNSDGTPVINTINEGLDYGSEYIVKGHEQYNNNLYWLCFVSSVYMPTTDTEIKDVPTILSTYYLPIYKSTNNIINTGTINVNGISGNLANPNEVLRAFSETDLVNKLASCFIVSEAPFEYTYSVSGNQININITGNGGMTQLAGHADLGYFAIFYGDNVPARINHSFTKYNNLKNYVTESKLLMYPYSYVQLLDGQGNNFIIKPEYLNDSAINITTYTSAGLNSKQAHVVENYRQENVTLSACRWELQNGIINSMPNNLTIVDDYTATYLQGNSNTIQTNISNTQAQANLNNTIAKNNQVANVQASLLNGISSVGNGAIASASMGGSPVIGGITGGIQGLTNIGATVIQGENYVKNTELQGNLTTEKTIASAMAKLQDAEQVADNVSLQGGDVYFTYQNQFSGYCLVYKQISDEYIKVLEDYFKKYGYKVNSLEIPNLHTRQSWDYIRTNECNVVASINATSLAKIRAIFNNGVTIWHTTDVGNYNLSNNEI